MKKALLITLALVLACITANAQLQVQKESTRTEKIAESVKGLGFLVYTEKLGYVMYYASSNRFDKSGYFQLGKELDGAVQTLKDLRELCDTIGDKCVTVRSLPGRECQIYASEKPGALKMFFDKNAGYCTAYDKDFDGFIRALESRKANSPKDIVEPEDVPDFD